MSRFAWVCAVLLSLGCLPAGAAPIIEYLFDEGSGSTATNSGTLGATHNGAINGGAYSASAPNGSAFSLDLNGTANNVKIPNFGYGAALTVEAWINPSMVNGQRVILDDYGNPGVLLAIVDGQLEWGISTTAHPGLGIALFAGSIGTGAWQHVAGVYDGAAIRAYVDGVLVAAAATSGPIIDNPAGQPTIGSDDVSPALDYAGLIDDFRIHQTALACEQLAGGLFATQCAQAPEPATLLLVALGAAMLLGRRRGSLKGSPSRIQPRARRS